MNEMNYIHVMFFRTELDEDTPDKEPGHIDSIAQTGNWVDAVQSLIDENKPKYHSVFIEDDHGVDLSQITL